MTKIQLFFNTFVVFIFKYDYSKEHSQILW